MLNELFLLMETYTVMFLEFLPGLVAGLIIIALGWLLAALCRKVIRILVRVLGFDVAYESILDSRVGDGIRAWKPSYVVSRVVYWFVILLVLISASDAMQLHALTAMLGRLLSYAPYLVLSIIFLAAGNFIGHKAAFFAQGVAQSSRLSYAPMIGKMVHVAIMLLVALAVLDLLQLLPSISTAILFFFAGLLLLLILVALLYSSCDMLRNLVAGRELRSFLQAGDTLDCGEVSGRLERVDSFVTVIHEADSCTYIPNNLLAKKIITKTSAGAEAGDNI